MVYNKYNNTVVVLQPHEFKKGILHFSVDNSKECRNEILALNPADSAKISFRHSHVSPVMLSAANPAGD